jgi:hypothetical protein
MSFNHAWKFQYLLMELWSNLAEAAAEFVMTSPVLLKIYLLSRNIALIKCLIFL